MNEFRPEHSLDMQEILEMGDGPLNNEQPPPHDHHVVIEDWSQTGRGSHVDFDRAEIVPIEQGIIFYHQH